MGSEENGITQDLLNLADVRTKIPMEGGVSSLNVGVATGMILYERLRQQLT
jgi:23S rRNA (guanosine2251-2'-O)-methyltransferase